MTSLILLLLPMKRFQIRQVRFQGLHQARLLDRLLRVLRILSLDMKPMKKRGLPAKESSIHCKQLRETMKNRDATAQMVQQRAEEFKKDPGAASVRALADVAALAASHYMGKGIGPSAGVAGETESTAAASTASKPGILKQAIQGEKVAQAPARAALESGAKSSAADAGVAAPNTAGQGLRRLMDEPIKSIAKVERGTYDAINRAAGTDLKSLHDYASKLQDALDDPQNIANTDTLEEKLKTTQAAIDKGEASALKEGITPADLQKAKGMTQQRYSMETLKQKLFNNEGVVEETLNMARKKPLT